MDSNTAGRAYIVGVGMTKFAKPKSNVDYPVMGREAATKALLDAHITYDKVEQAVASYCYGDSTCGQRILYQLGMTGIPVYNVNNNCASGSTAIVMARNLVKHGEANCVLVVGFEKMSPGSLGSHFNDRADPLGPISGLPSHDIGQRRNKVPFAIRMFGDAAREYISNHGAHPDDLAEIARVNHQHSQSNPYSQFQDVYTLDQIKKSPIAYGPLTKLQCCPTSNGAAAAVVVSESFLKEHPQLQEQAVEMLGQCLVTDLPSAYDGSAINAVGHGMTKRAALGALKESGNSISDVKVIELHDCFSSSELVSIDALGLTLPGKAHEYVRRGDLTFGSRAAVINPSGGLTSKGHPLGATGIAQCAELVWHLRGWANNRYISLGPTDVALQHNVGLGGAGVVTILRRADGLPNRKKSDQEIAQISGVGYNPAVEARGFTAKQAESIMARDSSDWMFKYDEEEKKRKQNSSI